MMNVYGEDPLWFNADTRRVDAPAEDHFLDLMERPGVFGLSERDFDEDDPSRPFRAAYRNGWVRIKVTPRWSSAAVETDSHKKARAAVAWVLDNRPELLAMDNFTVEIVGRGSSLTRKLDMADADLYSKKGVLPRLAEGPAPAARM
jgi:hypothetical protein